MSTESEALYRYFVKYSEFLNYVQSAQLSPIFFEVVQDGIVVIISDWERYTKYILHFQSISKKTREERTEQKEKILNELKNEYQIGEPPYIIEVSSSNISTDTLVEIFDFLALSLSENFEIVKRLKSFTLKFNTIDGLVNYFDNFYQRYEESQAYFENLSENSVD